MGRSTNSPTDYFAVGFQPSKDVDATTFFFLRHLNGTEFEPEEQVEALREGGDGQEVGQRIKTSVNADGQWVENSRPETGHRAAVAIFGHDIATDPQGVGTTASGLCNEHVAVPNPTAPYLTVEQLWADVRERAGNAMLTTLTLEFEAGRPLKITPEFLAGAPRRLDAASAMSPVREVGKPFMYPGASVVIDGAGTTKVTKGRIVIRRGVDGDIQTTGLGREDVVPLTFETEAQLTLKYEDAALVDKVTYSGGSQVPVDLATGSLRLYTQLGGGTNVRYQEWGINQMEYTAARVNKLNPEAQTMYLDVTAEGYKGATHQAFCRTLIASQAALV